MMKQARAQATVNTFGTTPEERLANLQAATDARKILQSPLNSGVREVAPGVRAATRDGQTVGFSTPGDGKTAPQGTITDPITGEQMPLALYNEMTRQTQATKGMTGGSPMERGLLAAMQAAEAKRAPAASSAATANAPKTPSVETFASMFPDTGLGLALASPVSNAPTSAPAPAPAPAASPAPVAAPAASPAVNAETTKLMEQVNRDPEVMRATKALASSRAQSAADAPQIAALNAYRDQMNRGTGVLDSAIVTNNDPMVMGMFPPASTGQNQRDSAEASDSLDAAQAAYENIMGKKPMSSARPAPAATGAKEPRGPTYFDVPPNATNQRALELAMEEMSIPSVAPAGYSAFSPQSRPTSAFPADVSTPVSAETTGAKGTRKALGGDKPKKAVRGLTYFDVPPNATNQRARK
jgi:hypothetical protein